MTRPKTRLTLIAALAGLSTLVGAKAGEVTYDFSTDPSSIPDMFINVSSGIPWMDSTGNPGGFLALLYSENTASGVVVFPDVDQGQTVASFNFETDVRVGNAQGNAGRPADGFSVNFARGSDPVLASLPDSATAANMAASGQAENGTATGIAIGFDTWSGNTLPDSPTDIEGIIVRVDNKTILKQPMPTRNGACADTTSMQTGPYNQAYWDGGGDPHDPAAWAGLCWAHLKVDLDEQGKLTVTFKGAVILDHFQTTYFPSIGRLVLAGRTGNANEATHFDNVHIKTLTSVSPLVTGLKGDPNKFVVEITDATGAIVDTNSVTLKLNSAAVTGQSLVKNGTVTTITYLSSKELVGSNLVDVAYKDATGKSYTSSRAFTVDPFFYVTTNTLFIEAEDADYGHGQYVTTTKIGMDGPYDGGSYKGLGDASDTDFDWHTDGNQAQPYRDATGLAADKENGSAGNNRGYFNVKSWWTLGWNDGGEWANYTRVFPTNNADYEVFGHLASGGAAINIELAQVTATQTNVVGYFAPGRATAGWDSLEIFPLVDTNGNKITVKMSGKQTLRATLMPGSASDMDFYAFRPAFEPFIAGLHATRTNISAVFTDVAGGPAINASSITLTLNGATVPFTTSKTGQNTTAAYATALPIGVAQSIATSFKDANGKTYSQSLNVTIPITTAEFNANTLFIEAEDADFGHGQYVTDKKIGMDGAYDGGAYANLGTADDAGFDWFTNGNQAQPYRPDTGIAADKENGSAGSDRGLFQVTSWWTLGWNDPGEWYNYTRTFPSPTNYLVFGHLASGGAVINIELAQITAGQGQADSNQVKKVLGYFAPGRATAGWDNLEIFPLIDTNGKPVTVTLGGKVTLRTTLMPGSASDQDYYAFIPTGGGGGGTTGGGGGLSIKASQSGNNLTLNLTGGTPPYLVQKKASLSDTAWVNVVTTSNSTVSVAMVGGAGFFRVQQAATASVLQFQAVLNGANERPNPVTTTATGLGSFSIDGNTLTYDISYSGLSSGATAGHIHGPADANTAAGVMIPFAPGPTGTSGRLKGTVTLTADQKANILAGMTYANIHTTTNGGGEIRGQLIQK